MGFDGCALVTIALCTRYMLMHLSYWQYESRIDEKSIAADEGEVARTVLIFD